MIFEYKDSKIYEIKLDDLLLPLDKRHNTLHSILKKYDIPLIEDAAEALGSFYNKQHAGTFGNIGALCLVWTNIISFWHL